MFGHTVNRNIPLGTFRPASIFLPLLLLNYSANFLLFLEKARSSIINSGTGWRVIFIRNFRWSISLLQIARPRRLRPLVVTSAVYFGCLSRLNTRVEDKNCFRADVQCSFKNVCCSPIPEKPEALFFSR